MKPSSFFSSRFRLSTGAFLFAALLAFAGSSASGKGVVSAAKEKAPVVEKKSVSAAADEAVLQKFYTGVVLKIGKLDNKQVERVCTPAMLRELRKVYAEEYDGTGYGIWIFRTCINGGDDTAGVLDIRLRSGRDYVVTYNDGGVKGETIVRMVTRNGRPMIDKIVSRDKGCR